MSAQFVSQFDRVVADMMRKFGTTAYIKIAASETYNVETSENDVVYRKIPVKAMFFDYLEKTSGLGAKNNTLIQSGDKQVFVQPPQKTEEGQPLPHLDPTKDMLEIGGVLYRIVFLKQHNPSLSVGGCVLLELFVRT